MGTDAAPIAVERLFEALRPELLRFAWWLARNRAVAEDVVQEALLRAWRSRDSLKDPAAARSWLLTIVRREHARLYERKRLEITDLDQVVAAEDSQLASDGDELVGLRLAITQLPDEYRVPLVMQVLGGFTTDEIAKELALSTPAVLTRLFRARNRLRRIYGLTPAPDGLDEPAL
ncbi:MAG TPA: sigma-70 family RNA polymerase sigma factor [Steroidobacteraceae bacterium]